MSKHIVIPDEREAKLKQIADAHNVSVSEAVGLLIGWAVENGKVEAGIPGIDISRDADAIEIDFGAFKRSFSVELAKAFAVALRYFARPKNTQFSHILEALSGAEVVGLSRQGTSIKVAGDNDGVRTLAPSVARELAWLVEAAAK